MGMISLVFDDADSESEWKDLEEKGAAGKVIETESLRILMTPGGMASGAPSLSFRFDMTDGTVVIARISVPQLFAHLIPAIRGRLGFLGIDEQGKHLARPDDN